jgi:hypothetical protein
MPDSILETKNMNTYHVYLRRNPLAIVSAASYTEDKRTKRFYFHSDAKTKDKETFFSVPDVAGINKMADGSSTPVDIYRDWDRVLENYLDPIEPLAATANQRSGKEIRRSK